MQHQAHLPACPPTHPLSCLPACRYCSPDESYRSKTDFCAGPIQVSNSQHEQYTVVSGRGGGGCGVGGSCRGCGRHCITSCPACLSYPARLVSALPLPRAPTPSTHPPCLASLPPPPPPPPQITVQEPRPTPGFLLEVATALSGMNVQIYQGVVQGVGCEGGDEVSAATPVVERQARLALGCGGWGGGGVGGAGVLPVVAAHAAPAMDALHGQCRHAGVPNPVHL